MGQFSYYAKATHATLHDSPCSTTALTYTLDTTDPTVTISNGPSYNPYIMSDNSSNYRIKGTCSENNRTVTVSIGGLSPGIQPICTSGNWQVDFNTDTPTDISEGAVTITADHTDAAGNSATQATVNVTKDTVAPSAPTIARQAPSGAADTDTTPTFRVTSIASGDVITLHKAANCTDTALATATADSTTEDLTSSTLASGSYTFYAKATDTASNYICSASGVAYQVLSEFGTLSWTGAYSGGNLAVPNTRVAGTTPSASPSVSGISLAYSTSSTACSVGSSNGTITATTPGSCVVTATFSKSGYANKPVTHASVTIVKGSQTLSWPSNPYGTSPSVAVNETLALVTAPTAGEGDTEYRSATTSKCTVGASTGTVTGVATGTCTVQARYKGNTNYNASIWVSAPNITVAAGTLGTISWPGNAYASGNLTVPNTRVLSNAPTITDTGTSQSYSSTTPTICSVSASTGTVTAIDNGSCIIRVTFSKTDYGNKTADHTGITVVDGSFGTLSWTGAYAGGNLSVPNARMPISTPSVNPTVSGITWAYSTSSTACSVNNNGAIVAVTPGSCVITATASKTGYTNKSVNHAAVTIVKGSQNLYWPSDPYGASPSIKVAGTLSLVSAPTAGQGDIEYQSTNLAQCTVSSSSGTITGKSVGTCHIQARYKGNTNYHPSNWVSTSNIPVVKGTQTLSWPSNPYGTSPNLAVSGTLALATAPTAGQGSIAYRSSTTTICSINASTGAISGLAVGTCTVQARYAGNTNYNASAWASAPNITVGKGSQSLSWPTNPYGTSPSVQVASTLALVSTPSAGQGSDGISFFHHKPMYCGCLNGHNNRSHCRIVHNSSSLQRKFQLQCLSLGKCRQHHCCKRLTDIALAT